MPLYQIDENKNFVPVQDTKKRWELTYTYDVDTKVMSFTGNTGEVENYIKENFNNITHLSLNVINGSLDSVLLFTKGIKIVEWYTFLHKEASETENILQLSGGSGTFSLSHLNNDYISINTTGTAILTIY